MKVFAASMVSSIFATTLSYPLDLAHGKMAADMSKKPSLLQNKNNPLSTN
jgi:hypothetical protein